MENAALILDYAISVAFLIWFTFMFYLSVKKCFWKEGKSRVKLFLLSLVTSPYLTYIEAIVVVYLMTLVIPPFARVINGGNDFGSGSIFALDISVGVVYMLMIFLYSRCMKKYLGTKTVSPVLFLYLMFNTLSVITNRTSGSGMMFSVPYLREIVDILGIIALFISVWVFYRLDVQALSKLNDVKVRINWKMFIVPPAAFTFLYSIFLLSLQTNDDIIEEKTVLIVYVFSSIIVLLFIWAFYVIIKNINAADEALRAKDEVKTLSVEVMEALAHTIDAKDEYTKGHSTRVAQYSRMLAEKLALSAEECENVYYMGLLHDIGKIGVPNAIINSRGKLTNEEFAVIKTHPVLGYEILAEIKSRPDLSVGARWHHERYDGKGYPDGKLGDEVPFLARIITVADSYDAMTSNRSYRRAMPQDKVRSEIEKNIGTQFDPDVARCMLEIIDSDVDYKLHE